MSAGVIAFALDSLLLQFIVRFLMGVQSTFFGPTRYGILPQHLSPNELTGGNGPVELGTFLSILLGTIVGTQAVVNAVGGSVWPVSGQCRY